MAKFLEIMIWLGASAVAFGQSVARPDVPDKIQAPAGQQIVLLAHASGSQIYVCQPGTDGKLAWNLKAPDAELHDQHGAVIGHHSGGPTWKNNDGSVVTGKAAASVGSPDPNSIPWLLVFATAHSGEGVLTHVATIQRINTRGGMPPAAGDCNAQERNSDRKSEYSADYYFYAPAPVH